MNATQHTDSVTVSLAEPSPNTPPIDRRARLDALWAEYVRALAEVQS